MKAFEIKKEPEKMSSINRTIRFKPEIFEEVMEQTEKTGVSFNKIVNQCIEYALSSMRIDQEGT